jgi:L-seryl-tRNA(Ser) seleniumtransferase
MTSRNKPNSLHLPSVDRLANHQQASALLARFGRTALVEAIRAELATLRMQAISALGDPKAQIEAIVEASEETILIAVAARLDAVFRPSFQAVLNLTGTVLHTNLGRAPLPQEAIDAICATATGASNLEFDLERGVRGDRDEHVEALLRRLTGAEAATVVNNCAAAVLLVLNALALKREVPVSRGELIEIGGSFRLPDIMSRAGCRLVEVGTTNRTHLSDFVQVMNPKTALVMKVHTSNYVVQGFTASVPEADLADACHAHGVPFVVDLGAGALIDLSAYGLPKESTPTEAIALGADLVLFSGDKLLGGPQVGLIVGKAALIAKIKRNPLKRALRIDKMSMAALEAVLRLYLHPEQLAERLPTLRLLSRTPEAVRAIAARVQPELAAHLGNWADVQLIDCESEIGSGAQPTQKLKSAGLAIMPRLARGRGGALIRLQALLRALPVPVIGRVEKNSLVFDFRCIENESLLLEQLKQLPTPA